MYLCVYFTICFLDIWCVMCTWYMVYTWYVCVYLTNCLLDIWCVMCVYIYLYIWYARIWLLLSPYYICSLKYLLGGKEKKRERKKINIIWKEDVAVGMVVVVELSETKSQKKKGKQQLNENEDRKCYLYLGIYYNPLFYPTGYHLSSSNSVKWHIGLICIRKSRFFEIK